MSAPELTGSADAPRGGAGHTSHGYGAYTNGCRCDVCRESKREYVRRSRAAGPRPSMAHGTSARFDHGCRCRICIAVKRVDRRAEYQRNQARRVAEGPVEHGTRNGYVNRGCRCLACTNAARAYNSTRRAS